MASYEYEVDNDIKIQEPKKYTVFLLNDDFSTMDFVVEVLITIFRKTPAEANQIMLSVHNNQKAACGTYTQEIAYTKVAQVSTMARKAGFPLKAIAQEEY